MAKLVTKNNVEFTIAYGGPVSITEGIVFLANITGSDVDTVHNTFKDPANTETMMLYLSDSQPGEILTGYVKYTGFSVDNDGGITVTLKKDIGA